MEGGGRGLVVSLFKVSMGGPRAAGTAAKLGHAPPSLRRGAPWGLSGGTEKRKGIALINEKS